MRSPRPHTATSRKVRYRGGWQIAAGIIAPLETSLIMGVYVLTALLETPAWSPFDPDAIAYTIGSVLLLLTTVAIWRPLKYRTGWVTKSVIIASWAVNLFYMIFLAAQPTETGAILFAFVPAICLGILIIGTLPLLRAPKIKNANS